MRSGILALLLPGGALLLPGVAGAQTTAMGSVRGLVTAQGGSIALPGAQVTIQNESRTQVAAVVSEGDGRFSIPDLPPGQFTVAASLDGFIASTKPVRVRAGEIVDVAIDLLIGGFAETVKVEASNPVVSGEGTLAMTEVVGGKELEVLAPSGGLQSVMRLFADVIQVPGGMSIKGGRPSQASFQMGSAWIVNPATGLMQLTLPDDAIESVSVLPNPYAAEYGRFSSGLTVIETRRGGDVWKVRLNVVDPAFRYKRNSSPLNIVGLGWYAPRVEVSGPLVKNRIFLEQTAQYRYQASEIGSLPQNQVRLSQSFSSFTRVDGTLTPRHTFVATATLFPSVTDHATLGTFTPLAAASDVRLHTNGAAFTERAAWADTVTTESTVQVQVSGVKALPQGQLPMELLPATTNGNFFNEQQRTTSTIQAIETLTASTSGPLGRHLFKVGFDFLHNQYTGSSTSRPVFIERDDGTLARRLDFSGVPTTQTVGSSDVAIFGQDRFQPHARWYTEFGLRLDRDGITGRFNLTPRLGSAVLLNSSGSAVLRGGVGIFYERTPSVAGAFDRFGGYVDTRYAAGGVTPLAQPVAFAFTSAADLETPRSRTWDLAYDQKLGKRWTFHIGEVSRDGSHELIVNPTQTGTVGAMVLSSTGRSTYRGTDIGMHFHEGTKADVTVTYTHASAREDQNSLTAYFDTILKPVIGADAYAPAATDVPNRLLARGRYMPASKWLFLGIFDWRSGLPYSTVNEWLDFVGPRNTLRFPTYQWLLLGAEHRLTFVKFKPWIGVHVWNALGSHLFSDVQANTASSSFGMFMNPEYRQYHIQLRFDR